jgi:hypothetical protein
MATREDRPSVIMGFPTSSHRFSAATGVAFVALLIASILVYGLDYPMYDDSGRVFAGYYADNSSQIQLSVLIGAFSLVALVWFVGFMRWVYAGAEAAARGFVRVTDIGYTAAVAGIALSTVRIAAQQAAVVATGTVQSGVIRALDLFGDYAFLLAGLFFSVWLLSSFFIIRVTKVLPAWIGVVALIGTVLGVLQSVLLLAPQDDDGVLGLLGIAYIVVLMVWVLAASVTIARRVETMQL